MLRSFIALIVLLGLSYFLFRNNASSGPNQIALLFCGAIAAGIAYKNGMPWNGIRQAVVDGIAIGLPAIMILLAVGALIGTWALSGTIITMVYYGLKLLARPTFMPQRLWSALSLPSASAVHGQLREPSASD